MMTRLQIGSMLGAGFCLLLIIILGYYGFHIDRTARVLRDDIHQNDTDVASIKNGTDGANFESDKDGGNSATPTRPTDESEAHSLENRISGSINTNVDPCVDLYHFSCGNWEKNNYPVTEPGSSSWGKENLVEYNTLDFLAWTQALLEESALRSGPLAQAKHFYSACMNSNRQDLEKSLGALVKSTLHELTLQSMEYDKEYMLAVSLGLMQRQLGFKWINCALSVVEPGPEYDLNSTYAILITPNSVQPAWELGTLAEGVNYTVFTIAEFLNHIHPITTNSSDMSAVETKKSQWMLFLDVYDDGVSFLVDPSNVENLRDFSLHFDRDFAYTFSSEKLRWEKAIERKIRLAFDDYEGPLDSSENKLKRGYKDRKRHCTVATSKHFNYSMIYEYVISHLNESIKEEIQGMFNSIRQVFIERVTASKSWSGEVKSFAIEKVNDITLYIGTPDWMQDKAIIDKMYQSIALNPTMTYGEMIIKVRAADIHRMLDLVNPHGRDFLDNWVVGRFGGPTNYNAVYSPTANSIVLFAGKLRYPTGGYPRRYLDYATLGTAIGHELTHAFDSLRRFLWTDAKDLEFIWDDVSNANFINQTECLVDSVSNYTNNNVNGTRTLDENISEMGGLYLSYYAYKKYVEDNGAEDVLPGLNYSAEQLFSIAYAQRERCNSITNTEALEQYLIETDEHPPDRVRVNLAMLNFPPLREAWTCPSTTGRICEIW